MSTSRALFLKEKSGPFELDTIPRPTPGPGEILVKEIAASLNPIDWKIQSHGFSRVTEYPAILGRDGAGEVEAVGEGVTQFKKGDRVFHQGGLSNGRYGTFQEYALVPVDLTAKLPANITFDQAASLPLAFGTAAVPLYSPFPAGADLKAPWDGGRGKYAGQPIVIFGGSSSVGQYVIQLGRLSGFSPIITTASLRNTDLLKSLGATHVVDRNIPDTAFPSEIAKITAKPIPVVYDAVSIDSTQQLGYDVLSEGGHLVLILSFTIKEVPGSTKKVVRGFGNLTLPVNREFGRVLVHTLPGLLEAGDIVPNPIEVVPGGLNGVVPGLDRLKNNLVSGKKLVVHPGETA